MGAWTLVELCQLVDHTNLRPDATAADMQRLCDEAASHHFRMVAIEPCQVVRCARLLRGTGVHVGAAIGFPLGQTTVATKVFETREALENGADEIDYVVNRSELKDGKWKQVEDEMSAIVGVCKEARALSKVIFETRELSSEEIIRLCKIASRVRPDFVKTSTGFSPKGGATVRDVRLMCEHVGEGVQVKAAGGIRDADSFLAMVAAGARRIGCTASIPIVEELHRRMDARGIPALELEPGEGTTTDRAEGYA